MWDEAKARTNRTKHGVSFDEAATAFRDDEGVRIFDPEHSRDEDRFLLLAMSAKGRLLVIVHCYRANESEIRIITARKADADEVRQYVRRKP